MKSAEISLKRQFLDLFYTHFYITGLSIVFGLGAFWWFLAQDKWRQLFSAVFIIIYFCSLYIKAHKIAIHDRKGYAKTKAYPYKGIVLAFGIVASIFALWCMYRISWVYMSIGGEMSGYTGTIYNSAFIFWTFPFNGIMIPYKGGMFWYAHVIIYLFPVLASGLGYFAGYKNFSLYEKFLPMMYEKNKK